LKAPPVTSALLAALLACGCASSAWEKTESVAGGRLYVPKVYAPLLPGSIYPDKKVAVPAKGRPAIVVVCPEKGNCRRKEILDQAAQRGLVVLVGRKSKVDLLRARAEANPARFGWLLVKPTSEFLARWTEAGVSGTAAAVMWPAPPTAPPPPFFHSKKILLAALLSDEPLEVRDGTVLKLYSPDEKGLLPREAFRDAVEWLAGTLETR
jgi:hypothetical protein